MRRVGGRSGPHLDRCPTFSQIGFRAMVVFPIISALVSVACAATISRDALRRPRPEKIVWAVAFAVFAIAAGTEAWANIDEWTPFVVRLFYLTGAVLVVAYLGLGELYLLAPKRMQQLRVVPGLTLLLTAFAATTVWSAAIDESRIAADGWEALERNGVLIALVAVCSGLGTVVIAGGALWSAWNVRRRGGQRHRMIGCILIAAGTLIVAAKGTLSRTGLPEETFALAMAVGVAVIYAGYLQTRRPAADTVPAATAGAAEFPADVAPRGAEGAGTPEQPSGVIPLVRRAGRPGSAASDPGITFIEERFLPLAGPALAELCRVWSVPPAAIDAFSRDEARRVWAFRQRLSIGGQAAFDAHDVPAQLALTDLFFEVLASTQSDPGSLAAIAQRG